MKKFNKNRIDYESDFDKAIKQLQKERTMSNKAGKISTTVEFYNHMHYICNNTYRHAFADQRVPGQFFYFIAS